MQDEVIAFGHFDNLRQILLALSRIDHRVLVVLEDTEVTINSKIDRGRLYVVFPVWVDGYSAICDGFLDRTIREDHFASFSSSFGRILYQVYDGELLRNHPNGSVYKYRSKVQPPILDFDSDPNAIIRTSALGVPDRSPVKHAVMTWFQEVLDEVTRDGELVFTVGWEDSKYDIYEIEYDELPLLVVQAGVGAPIAARNLEVLIEMGVEKVVAVGSSGGLHGTVGPGTIVLPIEAIRDEGTSYHYMRPELPSKPGVKALEALVKTLRKRGVIHTKAATWTTDAILRETRAQVARRIGQGCLTVEMEAAALFAVADFRGIELAQMLYVSDTLYDDEWDPGSLMVQPLNNLRRRLFGLAAEAVLAIS